MAEAPQTRPYRFGDESESEDEDKDECELQSERPQIEVGGNDEDQPQGPKDTRDDFLFGAGDLITILVGRRQTIFSVHRKFITERSNFFKAACNSDRWREGREKLVRLPEVHAAAFRLYVNWIYTGKVAPAIHWQKETCTEPEEKTSLLRAYHLGDLLDDSELRDKVLETLISRSVQYETQLSLGHMRLAWSSTPKGSPLRRVIIEWIIQKRCRKSFLKSVEAFPVEFVQELAVALSSKKTRNN